VDNEIEKRHHKELNTAIHHIAKERVRHLHERRRKLDEIAMVRAKHYERPLIASPKGIRPEVPAAHRSTCCSCD